MRTSVFVHADDVVTQAGLEQLLRLRSELYVVPPGEIDSAEVAVLGTDEIDDAAIRTVSGIQRDGCPRVAVVTGLLDQSAIIAAGRAGVLGLLRRRELTPEDLATVVRRVAGGQASVPADLVGSLLDLVGRTVDGVIADGGHGSDRQLSEREQAVLRLLADGCDTSEIATQLCYSERTVKGVIHEVTSRLHLRNRSHAVAFALRNGII